MLLVRVSLSIPNKAAIIFLVMAVCSAVAWGLPNSVAATQPLHPLAPPDTSSPRATFQTFLDEMNKAVAAFEAGRRDDAIDFLRRAVRCLNLEDDPPAIKRVLGLYSAVYLKETLDRIEIPPLNEIPDAKTVEAAKLSRWTIPYTEITIAAVKDGPEGAKFLFSPETVRRSEQFFRKVRNLPYQPGKVGALYEKLIDSAGPFIPRRLIGELPQWCKAEFLGQALWQWMGLLLYFAIAAGVVVLAWKCGVGALRFLDARFDSNLRHAVGTLILPIMLILFAQTGLQFVVYDLHFRDASVYSVIAFAFLMISYSATIWLIGALLNRAADVVIAVGKFESDGMYAQLIRLGFDVVTVVIVVATAIRLGAGLGLPTYSLVTGLGVGGLAVALAGREALSNLIGTVAILLDRPFKLGDFIVLGEGDRGTVTAIGLRSTRIRTRDGILVSIPNSNVATMKIVNESAPVTEARIRVPVGAAYGSSVVEVEQALLSACTQCEYVATDLAPSVRLTAFGDSSIEFQLFVWIVRPEFRERATNQLNRAIFDEFRKRGLQFPFPQRDVHIRTDE